MGGDRLDFFFVTAISAVDALARHRVPGEDHPARCGPPPSYVSAREITMVL